MEVINGLKFKSLGCDKLKETGVSVCATQYL